MFIHYKKYDGCTGLINLEEVMRFEKWNDGRVYAYDRDGDGYLVIQNGNDIYSDGKTPYDVLCTAVREGWPMFGAELEADEKKEKRA